MILAAGRGERMRPLTDTTPKPMLNVAGKPLIQHVIENLVAAGYLEIVINLAHLGEQISAYFGTGQSLGANIVYTDEGATALETAGGIVNALPVLGPQPFVVVNGDIASDFPLSSLRQRRIEPPHLAHLVLVDNPPHHQDGDFSLGQSEWLAEQGPGKLTFSGIGLYHPDLFRGVTPGKSKLGPLLTRHMAERRVSGERYQGFWMDIGTPKRLQELNTYYQQRG